MKLRRAPRLPDDVLALLGDARPLAAAPVATGGWVVATTAELLLEDRDGVRTRAPWIDMESGRWDGEHRRLHITWVDGTRPPLAIVLGTEQVTRFAVTVRERIQASLVHSADERLPAGGHARVHIRRDPSGALLSQLTVEGRLRGDDEERRIIDRLEADARATVGLDT